MLLYIHSPWLSDADLHPDIGGPIVAKTSLVPVPSSFIETFSRTRAEARGLTATEAGAAIVDAITGATKELDCAVAQLQARASVAQANVDEAKRLADLPVQGNEVQVIRGFVAALNASLGEPYNAHPLVSLAKRALPAASGLDPAPIKAALADYDARFDAGEALRRQLMAHRDTLEELIERAQSPEAMDRVRKVRTNVKLSRLVTAGLTDEMERIHSQMRAALSSFEEHLKALRKATA